MVKTDLDEAFNKLQPFLQVGYSFHKSCVLAMVAYSTLYPYYSSTYPETYDPDFYNRCERERHLVSLVARQNIIKTIKGDKEKGIDGDVPTSFKWLERQEPEDFSSRLQITDGEGGSVNGGVVGLLTQIVNGLTKQEPISPDAGVSAEPEANNPESETA